MMRGSVSGSMGVCLALAGGAGARGAIINAGFEPGPGGATSILPGNSTAIPGWITSDSGVEWFMPSSLGFSNSPAGGFVVDLANYVYSAGGIYQSFATTPGQSYDVTFWLGSQVYAGRDGTAQIIVSAASTSQNFSIAALTGNITWQSRTFSFTANAATTTLSFRCTQNAFMHFAYIDGLSMVPTPGAAGLIVGAVVMAGRRRRTAG